jgi:hypothetical protein
MDTPALQQLDEVANDVLGLNAARRAALHTAYDVRKKY